MPNSSGDDERAAVRLRPLRLPSLADGMECKCNARLFGSAPFGIAILYQKSPTKA